MHVHIYGDRTTDRDSKTVTQWDSETERQRDRDTVRELSYGAGANKIPLIGRGTTS